MLVSFRSCLIWSWILVKVQTTGLEQSMNAWRSWTWDPVELADTERCAAEDRPRSFVQGAAGVQLAPAMSAGPAVPTVHSRSPALGVTCHVMYRRPRAGAGWSQSVDRILRSPVDGRGRAF